MNPPICTRGTRATYPVPRGTGRYGPDSQQQIQHASSVQLSNGTQKCANRKQHNPMENGQYRKTEGSLRRLANHGWPTVSFEDDHAVQKRDKTVMRPRSVSSGRSYQKSGNQIEKSELETVRRPRSVTFVLPDGNDIRKENSKEDYKNDRVGILGNDRYSSRPEKFAFSTAGCQINQTSQASSQRSYSTPQGLVNAGEQRSRNASYRAAFHSATNQQKARAMQQIMNGYETMNPLDYNRNKTPRADCSDYVPLSQQRVSGHPIHGERKRTTNRKGYDQGKLEQRHNGYEEMKPQNINSTASRSFATSQQNVEYINSSAVLNGAYGNNARMPPYSKSADHRDGSCNYASFKQKPQTQQAQAYENLSSGQNAPYSSTFVDEMYNHTNEYCDGACRHPTRGLETTLHSAATASQKIPHYNMTATRQNVTCSHTTSQQYGGYHPPARPALYNLPYTTLARPQNERHFPTTNQPNRPRHSTVTSQHSIPCSCLPSSQQGISYSSSGLQKNGVYDSAVVSQHSMPYSSAATQQDEVYSHENGNHHNGACYPASTLDNGFDKTAFKQDQDQDCDAAQHENGYDGYDSSDSDFDDTDNSDDDAQNGYEDLSQWNGVVNTSTDEGTGYQQPDR